MNRKALDLVAVASIAALAMTLTLHAPLAGAARIFFALPLVLALPGYAIVAAAFPGGAPGLAERAALSLGLSLAVAALGGLALHQAPAGLRAGPWAVLLGNITLVASLVALVRRARHPGPARPALSLSWGQALAFGLAGLLVCSALVVARDGALRRDATRFTQLWALPAGAAGDERVRLGVANMEGVTVRYRLELESGGGVVSSWPAIVLGPDQRWEEVVALPPSSGTRAVEAVLYRMDDPGTPYRRVVLDE